MFSFASSRTKNPLLGLICLVVLLSTLVLLQSDLTDAFAPISSVHLFSSIHHQQSAVLSTSPASSLNMVDSFSVAATTASSMSASSTSMHLSAGTLDPTTILSDILGGLLGTPAILLVPIVAALGLASLIAFLIVSYANPVVEDDEI